MNSLYLALDFATWNDTQYFLKETNLKNVPVKIGMELFYGEGPGVVYHLKKRGHPVFLDLKLHDIPTTVNKTMTNLTKVGVDMVTVHASGGSDMIQAARQGLVAGGGNPGITPKLIAVTVLTSTDEHILQQEMHIDQSIDAQTYSLATLAEQNGADGVVCSVTEASGLRSFVSPGFLAVTPGIRIGDKDRHDQVRTASPTAAKKCGADVLVVGRAITQADDPAKTYAQMMKEWTYDVCN